MVLVKDLGTLKGKIAVATAPVQDRITELSYYKQILAATKALDCTEVTKDPYSHMSNGPQYTTYNVHIKNDVKEKYIVYLENEIQKIQDELDVYNANTSI